MSQKLLMLFIAIVPITFGALAFAEDQMLETKEPAIVTEVKEICRCPAPGVNKKSRKVVGKSKRSKSSAARQARYLAHHKDLGEWKAACAPQSPNIGSGNNPKETTPCPSKSSGGIYIETLCFDFPCL